MLSNTCAGIENPYTRAKNVRIVVRGGGIVESADDEEEGTGDVRRTNFIGEEEEVQMIYVDSMYDGSMFARVEADTKYGKMG